MKVSNRVYPLAPRRWMPPSPSIRRLGYALESLGLYKLALSPLHQTLLRSIEAGTVDAANATVDVLRRELVLYGKTLSRKNAQTLLASYLGVLPWETRLLQMKEEPVPVSVSKSSPITWWRDNVTTWARFVYRVTDKLEGHEFAPTGNDSRVEVRRARILTQGTTATQVVTHWKQQFLQAQPDSLVNIAYGREDAYLGAPRDASQCNHAPRFLTHYVIVEAVLKGVIDHMEGEPLMQSKLRKLHHSGLWSEILGPTGYRTPVGLIPVSEEDIPGFADCLTVPGHKLKPWPLESRGWTHLDDTEGPFTAVMDISKTSGWDNATSKTIGTLTMERFGIVQPAPGRSPSRLGSFFAPQRDRKLSATWQDIVRTAPFNEAVHTGNQGLLLSRASGEVVRFAPWTTGERHFSLGEHFSEQANALTLELAAQAHADGMRVLVYGDNHNWPSLLEELAPGRVIHLNEDAPLSLNPFSGVSSEEELQKLLPAFVNLTYDLLGVAQNLASQALNRHFVSAWKLHGADLELKHVANQFRVYGKHNERALQALIDHFVDTAGQWISGRAADCLKSGITCIDASKLTRDYETRYVLGPTVSHLVVALAYRNAVAAHQCGETGSLALLAPTYLEGSRNRAELLMSHFSHVGGSIGFKKCSYGSQPGLSQAFKANRAIPSLHIGLAQDSPWLHRLGLNENAIRALPSTYEKQTGKLSLTVLKDDETLGSFILERPLGKN